MKKLRRSRNNRIFCGVMGGIAEYFEVDPTIVRVLFLIFCLTGFPIFLYILLAIIIPEGGSEYRRHNRQDTYYYTSRNNRPRKTARKVEDEDNDDWSDF